MNEQQELEYYICHEMAKRYIGQDNSNTLRLIKLKNAYAEKYGFHLLDMLVSKIEIEIAEFLREEVL